eukprot:SAG31_NODE_10415_length_1140_cov_18.818444_2_plen_77_part_00
MVKVTDGSLDADVKRVLGLDDVAALVKKCKEGKFTAKTSAAPVQTEDDAGTGSSDKKKKKRKSTADTSQIHESHPE